MISSFDFAVLNFIYAHCRSGILDILMPLVTKLGNGGAVWIALAAVLLIIPRYRKVGGAMLLALALDAAVCGMILKPLVARIRPCDVDTAVRLLIQRPADYSFPSGHAAASFSAASALYFGRQQLWRPAFVLAALIAFSRLYLYVHYPTDVLAGAALGMLMGYIGVRAAALFSNQ